MQIWFKQNGEALRLPVLPGEFNVTTEQENVSVNINAYGEALLKGNKHLKTISFESFFTKRPESYCEFKNIKKPEEYIKAIEKMERTGKLKLVITGVPISGYFLIEHFNWSQKDGSGDYYYEIELKECPEIDFKIKARKKKAAPKPKKRPAPKRRKPKYKTYKVKRGDCLWNIARKFYGNGTKYTKIYNANRDKIKRPNLIYPGQVLKIP